jgi:hypothetical protein
MIDILKLTGVNHIIVHEHCPDGIASAMILHQVLPNAKISHIQYDTEEHRNLVPEPGMLFCDFSPCRENASKFLESGAIVLDHHARAWDICRPFVEAGIGVFGDTDSGVSGAVLAYREVYNVLRRGDPSVHAALEHFASLAGIRDTWQTKNLWWSAACEQAAALHFWPEETLINAKFYDWNRYLELGPVLQSKALAKAKQATTGSYRFMTRAGLSAAVFEGGGPVVSDAAELLGQEVDIVVGFTIFRDDTGWPVALLSFRSHKDFDAGAFCLAHGGGGHTKAAGCRVRLTHNDPQPFTFVRRLIENYEPLEVAWKDLLDEYKDDKTFSPIDAYNQLLRDSGRSDSGRRVYIESPLAGDFARNIRYARLCLLDCLRRGEFPYASHLLYTQALDDRVPADRKWGMEAGDAWRMASDYVVAYTDLGVSPGMEEGLRRSGAVGLESESRKLPEDLMKLLDDPTPFGTKEATK